MPVGFRGAVLTAPGVATYIDDSLATGAAAAAATSVAVVGAAERGQPNVALAFNDTATALAVYGPSSEARPLVAGITRALNAGSGTVYGVRVGRAKPFASFIPTATNPSITITTNEYGKFCKSWSLKVDSSTATISQNSNSIGRKVTLTLDDGRQYTVDNIAKSLLQILSASSSATGTVTVSSSSISLTQSGGSAISYAFSDYSRLSLLIAAINADAKFTVSLSSGADGNIESSTIGQVSSGSIPASTGVPYVLQGNVKALVDALNGPVLGPFLNATFNANSTSIAAATYYFKYYISVDSSYSGYIDGNTLTVTSISTGAVSIGQILVGSGITSGTTITAFVGGSGGTGTYTVSASQTAGNSGSPIAITAAALEGTLTDYDPTPIDSDWINAFVALQSVPAYFVVPMSGSATHHATALAHAISMSLPTGRSERIAVMGGVSGETSTQAIARASGLNDKRAVLCWPGIKDYDDTGSLVTRAPFYLAAQIAGTLAAQGDPAEPLTNKSIGLYGLESSSSNAVVDNLVGGGVLTIRNEVGRGFVVVQSLTTWTGDLKFTRREISTIRAADETMKAVRLAVTPFVGRKSTVTLQSSVKQAVIATLQLASSRGLIVSDPTNPTLYPAFANVSIRVYGDAYYIDFNCSPAKPANYMLITAYVS